MPDDDQMPELDIIDVCKEILLMLLEGKQPDEVQAMLSEKEIDGDDAQNLINITIACTQEVSPVIEQRRSLDEAMQKLVEQGMDAALAANMANMILATMGDRAAESAGVDLDSDEAPVISQEEMTVIMRLAMAVDIDLNKGVDPENIAEAISNISDIEKIKDIKGAELDFVQNVKLARAAAERTRAGLQLPEVIKQLGLNRKPPYVPVLALFFLKAAMDSAPNN